MKQRGISMIELLVAMAISAFLMVGVVQVYTNTLTNTELLGHMSALQEKARFAIDLMSEDIRGAGFQGCNSEPNPVKSGDKSSATATMPQFQPLKGIAGWDAPAAYAPVTSGSGGTAVSTVSGSWSSSAGDPVAIENTVRSVPGSDVLRVWSGTSTMARITDVNAATGALTLDPATTFTVGEYVFAANCDNSFVVQVCAGSTANTINVACNASSEINGDLVGGNVYSERQVTYFVGKLNNTASNKPALFRDAGDGTGPQELVRGVESMQVLYGEDIDQDDATRVDGWVTAANVSDWQRVKSVRLSFVVQSESDNVIPDSQSFEFDGATINPTDKRLRRVFTQTVNLRNRMYGGAYD